MYKQQIFRYAIWSQACLLGGVLVCLAIRPTEALANYPISYFGNFRDTILPYAGGFLLSAYWLMRTARILPPTMRATCILLVLIAICMLGILCTPYMISSTIGWIHLSLAIILLTLELSLSVLFIIHSRHLYAILGFLTQLLGAVFAILSQTGHLHVELIAELAVIIGFGVLFSYNLSLLDTETAVKQGL